MRFIINNDIADTYVHPATTLLDFLRKHKHLIGTKEGCREGDCGACTVLLGELNSKKIIYKNVNSCLLPVADTEGKHIITIEGLNNKELSPFQKAMVDEGGTQCGFCTPGFIVSFTGYLMNSSKPDFNDAVESIGGNICRCTGHSTIKRAVSVVLDLLKNNPRGKTENHLQYLIRMNIIPEYISGIPKNLKGLEIKKQKTKIEGEIIGGGTDIFVRDWEKLLEKKISVIGKPMDVSGIKINKNFCVIMASATVSEIEDSAELNKFIPGLKNFIKLFGSGPIRNRATVGGNIINASPIGDMTNILLALNSKITLKGKNSSRVIFLKDFYRGYKLLDLKKNEMLKEIKFSLPRNNSRFNFEKVSKRTSLDIASVNSSIYIEVKDRNIKTLYLSAGGVAPVPLLLKKTSEFLTGKKLTEKIIRESIPLVNSEISPISDVRGSADYKRLLLRQLIYAHFIKLFPEFMKPEELL